MSVVRQRFSIIPATAVTDPRLEPRDLQMLCLLGRHTDNQGWCTRSQVRMAKELSCGRATVQRALQRLGEAGYVEHRKNTRSSGADAAHDYRVVIDPKTPPEEEPRPAVSQAEEGVPIDGQGVPTGGQGCPPMGGQGVPTHERAPMLTTPVKRLERERAETGEDAPDGAGTEPQGAGLSRAAWLRRLKKLHARWPTYVSDSFAAVESAWFDLSPEDREKAGARLAAYVAKTEAVGRKKHCAFAVYLKEKRWERLPEQALGGHAAQSSGAKPFSQLWSACRLALLLDDPSGRQPPLTAFQQRVMDAGGPMAQREKLARLAKYGWPLVNRMHEDAGRHRGEPGAGRFQALAEAVCFDQVQRGTALWDAWAAEHAARGWPWPGDIDHREWLQFPGLPGGCADGDFVTYVRRVLETFERVKAETLGAAAERQAG